MFLDVFPTVNSRADQSAYQEQAKRLEKQGLFKWAYVHRAPGYIVFLAGLYKLNGSTDKNIIRIEQGLLGAVSVALLFGITQLVLATLARRERTRIALVAAGLWAFYPDAIFFTQTYYTETLFVLLALGGFYFLLRAYRSPQQMRWLVWSGVAWGLAALTREVALAFIFLGAPVWLLLVSRTKRWVRAGIFVGVCLLVILPWTGRNLIQTHTLLLISTQGFKDLWLYNTLALNPQLTEEHERIILSRMNPKQRAALQQQSVWIKKALQTPLHWAIAKAREVAEIWRDPTSNWAAYGPSLKLFDANTFAPIETVLESWHLFLFAALLVGLVWSPEPTVTLLAAFYLGASSILFFLTHYMPRFRLDLQPILIPFTAFGIYVALPRRGRHRFSKSRTRLMLTVGLLVLFAISLVLP